MKDKKDKVLTLKTLNKSNVWDVQENDIFRMWEAAERDVDMRDNMRHYQDVIKSAFIIEEIKIDKPEVIKKYEERGFKVAEVKVNDEKVKWGIQKKAIRRVTDLTYENIKHISAQKLIEVLERNFGGGWDSLPQSVQDIIQHGFDISTTTLPADRLKKPGGLYDKKVADGYEVLEIPKGSWTEAIFAKEKPRVEIKHTSFEIDEDEDDLLIDRDEDSDDEEDGDIPENDESYRDEEEDDEFDDDKLTEESYRTNFDEDPEALSIADDSDEEEF
jgi:hypothetical protein